MVKLNNGMLAAGVLIGAGAIYAYKNDLQIDKVMNKIELNTEKFTDIIEKLIELGREFLLKLYEMMQKLFRQVLFKLRLVESESI